MDVRAKLVEIEAAVLAAKPKFRFRPPASGVVLEALRAAVRDSAPDVMTWFAWHAGSQDGFLPDSSVCIIDPSRALHEIEMLAAPPLFSPQDVFCPLLEDGGGGLWLYVARGDGEVWCWDRGETLWTKPLSAWLDELLATWVADERLAASRGSFARQEPGDRLASEAQRRDRAPMGQPRRALDDWRGRFVERA